MVIVRIDQFDRNYPNAEPDGDLLVTGCIAAHAIAGHERVAAEQGVARSFEIGAVRRRLDTIAVLFESGGITGFFSLPLQVAKSRQDGRLAIDQRRIGRENQVGQAFAWSKERYLGTRIFEDLAQGLPLGHGHHVIALTLDIHPRIDLVFDPK